VTSRPADEFEELRGILDALCEESITPAQVRRLEELILASPEAEAFYVQFMAQFADLSRRFAGRPAAAEFSFRDRLERQPVRVASPVAHGRWRLAALVVIPSALAAGLLLAVIGLPWWGGSRGPGDPMGEPTDDSVAVLLQAPGAVWENTDAPPRVGAPLRPGWLHLKSGAAQIEFYSGATVILQGPADFELVSQTRANCTRGKLRGTVPPQAEGFAIGAPNLDLVDRGTEFGMKIGEGTTTEVQVFQGRVDLYDPGSMAGPPKKALTTGQGLRVDGQQTGRPIAPTPADFPTAQELAGQTQKAIRERQAAWVAASATVRQDPSLAVYFPFEAIQPWARTLADQAQGRKHPRDGAIVGCGWADGRWPGKRGLEFKQVSDRVRVTVPGELDSVTLATWVRVDALPNQNNSLFMADRWAVGHFHWQIGRDGSLILGIKYPPETNNAHYKAVEAFTPDRLGRWSFIAVVYDRDGGRVTHYLDGTPVSREPILEDIALRVGNAELGNWNNGTFKGKDLIRYLSGCMDEFMLFTRPLDDAEIVRLYETGRPPT
jgi:hypothetical protein